MSLNIKILLDKRRAKNDGSFPLVMRILYDRKSTNISLGYALHEKDWDARTEKIKASSKVVDKVSRLNNYIHKQRTKAYDLFTKLQDEDRLSGLSLVDIKKLLIGKTEQNNLNVFDFIDETINELNRAKKYGNARVYLTLRNKLKSHIGHEMLVFSEIDYSFLKKLETSHYEGGSNVGSLSVYMRTLRATYNKAIMSGTAKKEEYPFKDYTIKNGKPVRRALSINDFNAFKEVQLVKGSIKDQARKLFLASFYLRGMNWMDMAFLTKSNIQGEFERVNYVRRKTNEPLNIKIHPNLKVIFNEYSTNQKIDTEFLFPIIPNEATHDQYISKIRDKRKRVNKKLKEIAKSIGIEEFTIYAARHTYATMGKHKGVPTAVIQESLGHSTEAMTQTYLDSFENKVVDDFDELIMNDL